MNDMFIGKETTHSVSTGSGNYDKSAILVDHEKIGYQEEHWHREVQVDLELRLGGDSSFPCVFSKNAFKKKLLKFIFMESIDPSGIEHLANGLSEYVALSETWDGSLDTAYPLITAFSQEAVKAETVSEYHAIGWRILQQLHYRDTKPWPSNVGQDPNFHTWSMCFSGMQLFFNMSNPAHEVRKSRNLGRHFIFIVNPRERFDIFAGNTPIGRRTRATVRKRIERYDGIAHCSQLSSYEAGGVEWWQYGIIEENTERTDQCPFRVSSQRSIHGEKSN